MKMFKKSVPMALSLTLLACSSSNNEAVTPDVVADTPAPASDTKTPVTMKADDKVVPVLTLSFTPTKTFRFTWAEVPGATSYNIKEAITVASGFDITPIVNTTDIATRSFDYVVPLYARLNAKYILQSCNADGCAESAEVHTSTRLTDMADSIGYFKASNTDSNDDFGSSVSLSKDGNTLAVGAVGERSSSQADQNDDSVGAAGAVYVFTRNNTSAVWSQQAYLKATMTSVLGSFGTSVSLSKDGNTLAVGAYGEAGNAKTLDEEDSTATEAGAVYVFARTVSAGDVATWTQKAYLKASNIGERDRFGYSVSISNDGNILAVGAPGEDSNATGVNMTPRDDGASNSGAAYVFVRDTATTPVWSQHSYLKANNTGEEDGFGESVSISADGNTLAVGAWKEGSDATGININMTQTNNESTDSGAVYTFTRSTATATWSEQAYIKARNTGANDKFGISMALSTDGGILAVGARKEDSNAKDVNGDQDNDGAEDAGAVYVY